MNHEGHCPMRWLKADLDKIEEDGSPDESGSSSDSEASSSDSFGCQSDDEEDKKKRKKQQAKAAAKKQKVEKEKNEKGPKEEVEKGEKPEKQEKQEKVEKEKGGKRTTKKEQQEKAKAAATEAMVMESAEKLLALLTELGGSVVWRSVVRATEIDRRLGRVHQVQAELQDAASAIESGADTSSGKVVLPPEEDERSKKIVAMHQKLTAESKRVAALKDLCKFIRGASVDDMISDVSSGASILHYYGECFASLICAEGTLVEMIQTIAKKLLDAPDFLFFKFLQLRDSMGPEVSAVNLASLWRVPPEPQRSETYHALLRRAQHSGMECFYDKLKGNNGVEWAKDHLDPSLRTQDFDQPSFWFLGVDTAIGVVRCSFVTVRSF
eukprot:Skav211136  [mRNA]  locus=scaffold4091:150919:152465:+ [translate_table: standard]